MPGRNRWDAINLPLRGGSQFLLSFYTYWFRLAGPIESYGGYESRQNIIRPIVRPPSQRLYVYAFLLPCFVPPVDSIYTVSAKGEHWKGWNHDETSLFSISWEIDAAAWRERKKYLKNMETVVEGCVHVKEEERPRIVRLARNYEKRDEPRSDDWTTEEWREMTVEWCICRSGERRVLTLFQLRMGWPRLA